MSISQGKAILLSRSCGTMPENITANYYHTRLHRTEGNAVVLYYSYSHDKPTCGCFGGSCVWQIASTTFVPRLMHPEICLQMLVFIELTSFDISRSSWMLICRCTSKWCEVCSCYMGTHLSSYNQPLLCPLMALASKSTIVPSAAV